jgi:predicted nucleic acid-binding protein
MPEIIFDCCCISNFALSESLFVLESVYRKSAYISNFVSAEILKGIQQGHKDLTKIQEALREGWLKEAVFRSRKEKSLYETLSVSLGHGEASSISMAKSRGFVLASDDGTARREAGLLDVKLTGTLSILKKAIRDKTISLNDGNQILAKMIDSGFYSALKSLKNS